MKLSEWSSHSWRPQLGKKGEIDDDSIMQGQ